MKILIVDDHQLFIDGVRHLLSKITDNIDLIECNNADEAIDYLDDHQKIDLILADLNLPDLDGFSIIKRVMNTENTMPIIAISADNDIAMIQSVIKAGANGFIPKSSSSSEFISGIRHVLNGEVYVPKYAQHILEMTKEDSDITGESHDDLRRNRLTSRQLEILELLAHGYTNKQIAKSLHIAENTVKVHLSAIYSLLDVSSRTLCIKAARKKGIID